MKITYPGTFSRWFDVWCLMQNGKNACLCVCTRTWVVKERSRERVWEKRRDKSDQSFCQVSIKRRRTRLSRTKLQTDWREIKKKNLFFLTIKKTVFAFSRLQWNTMKAAALSCPIIDHPIKKIKSKPMGITFLKQIFQTKQSKQVKLIKCFIKQNMELPTSTLNLHCPMVNAWRLVLNICYNSIIPYWLGLDQGPLSNG